MSAPYPHYCAVHNVYYGSPTDTIPATMCPLCGVKAELVAQPVPRTYEVARALSWVDAVEQAAPSPSLGGPCPCSAQLRKAYETANFHLSCALEVIGKQLKERSDG